MRRIPTRYLREGSIVAEDVYDSNFNILIKKNSVIDKKSIENFRKFNIISVYVKDEYSSSEISEIINPALRIEAAKKLKKMAIEFKNSNSELLKAKYVEDIKSIIQDISCELYSKNKLLLQQIDIRNLENFNYSHSVNVAIMSMVLAISLNYDRKEVEQIGLAGILHDIGKVFVSKEIIIEEIKSVKYEGERTHCELGYKFLADLKNLNKEVKKAILHHHELIDGTGYPNKLKGDEIEAYSQIIGVADFYDQLMAKGYLFDDNLPNNVIEQIMSYANSVFNFEIVKAFAGVVKPFPEGTIVKLNTGDIAIVKGTMKGVPLRPIVKLVKSKKNEILGMCIDLSAELDLTIVDIIYYI